MVLDRKEPYYAVIVQDILDQIQQGALPVGALLPTEDELSRRYRNSRGTVRRAMSYLENQGYISRRPGVGTRVERTRPRLVKQLGEIKSFSQQLADAGMQPVTEVLFAGLRKASELEGRAIEAFEVGADTPLVHIRRLKKGDGIPFAVQSVYLLPALCPGILEESPENLRHLFRLYRTRYQRTINTVDEILRLGSASAEEAHLLQVEPGSVVVLRDRISYDQNEQPFEVLHSIDRGDRFMYHYKSGNDWKIEKL